MNFNEIKNSLQTHPSLTLLRDRNAPLILGFLYSFFSTNRMAAKAGDEMQLALSVYLEEIEYSDEDDKDFLVLAGKMLDLWCSEEKRYIRRYTNDRGGVVFELTSYTEKTIRWIEDLAEREFVGTESRFSDIHRRLKDLVEGSQEDPEIKLEQLLEKRKEINREIREIREKGIVKSYEAYQIKERFEDISRSARDLLSDFKLVEENFKQITRKLFESEMDRQINRGAMLQLTLDAADEMRNTPQGKSFEAFWQFLMADAGKDEINTLVESVYSLLPDNKNYEKDDFLSKLKHYLHHAGLKILETNHKMSEKLNRILSDKHFMQIHKIREDIREIKKTIIDLDGIMPDNDNFMYMESEPEISMVMDRPLSLPREETVFTQPEEEDLPGTDLSILIDRWVIDPAVINKNISEALKDRISIRLDELLELYPPQKGLGEIMAYMDRASRTVNARINDDESTIVEYTYSGKTRRLTIPEVVFIK